MYPSFIRGRDCNYNIWFDSIHFLLHLTGEKTIQPIFDNDIVCLFNGEIYNYKEILPEAKSDVYIIVDVYKKYGKEFVKYLDVEFVIIFTEEGPHKFKASEVSGINGGKLMCETRNEFRQMKTDQPTSSSRATSNPSFREASSMPTESTQPWKFAQKTPRVEGGRGSAGRGGRGSAGRGRGSSDKK